MSFNMFIEFFMGELEQIFYQRRGCLNSRIKASMESHEDISHKMEKKINLKKVLFLTFLP